MVRKIFVIICDNCDEQEPANCSTVKQMIDYARSIGWKVGKEAECPYCQTLGDKG